MKAVAERYRIEFCDIIVSCLVFAQKHEVVEFWLARLVGVILAKVKFGTDNRFDSRFFARVEKSDRAVHIAVVGNRYRVHSEFFRAFGYRVDPRRAVEQTVFRMNVQMHEITHCFSPSLLSPQRFRLSSRACF